MGELEKMRWAMSKKSARNGTNQAAPFEVDDRREHPFFMVDNALIQDYGSKIGVYGIAAYNVLAMYAGSNSESWPSYQTIADLMNASRPLAVKAIQTLSKYGLIKKEARLSESGDRASNRYILTKQSEWGLRPEDEEGGKGGKQDLPPSKPDLPPDSDVNGAGGGKQNLLPSKPNLPQVVNHDNHLVNEIDHGGKQDLPRVVNHIDHGGKPHLPEQYTKNNTHIDQDPMNKGFVGVPPTPPHPDSWDEFLAAFCWVCYGHMQIHNLTEKQRGALTGEAKQIYGDGYTRTELRAWFADHWKPKICYRNDKQRPQPHEVRSSIPILRDGTSEYADYELLQGTRPAPPAAQETAPEPPAEPKTPWEICLSELKLSLGEETYAWLDGSQLIDAGMIETRNKAGQLIKVPLYQVCLQNPAGIDWIRNRALLSIRRTMESMMHSALMIEIVANVSEAA